MREAGQVSYAAHRVAWSRHDCGIVLVEDGAPCCPAHRTDAFAR
jgi:hypothetical protein